jgi:hypothetical protein
MGERDVPRLRGRQGDYGGLLEVPLRVWPQGRRGPEVMLVVGDPFAMLVAVGQGHRVAGRLFSMPMVTQGMGSQPEQLRHRGSGKEEKGGGESAASRHGAIVAHPVVHGQIGLIRRWRKATFSVCAWMPM